MKELIVKLQASFATLSQRDRQMALILAGVAIFVLVVGTGWGFSRKADRIRKSTAFKMSKLDEVQALAKVFHENEAQRSQTETQLRGNNIRLITYLEEKAAPAGVELPVINPKADVTLEGDKIVESAVELTLTDVKLNRFLDFLAAVETAPDSLVKVKYMRIEPRVSNESLTAWLTIATYKAKN